MRAGGHPRCVWLPGACSAEPEVRACVHVLWSPLAHHGQPEQRAWALPFFGSLMEDPQGSSQEGERR